MTQRMDDDADSNAATQTTGDNADNNNALPCRQQGDATTSRKRVVVVLVRTRAVAIGIMRRRLTNSTITEDT
jgi:hypothetical protein